MILLIFVEIGDFWVPVTTAQHFLAQHIQNEPF
jgi:hypothetical protein